MQALRCVVGRPPPPAAPAAPAAGSAYPQLPSCCKELPAAPTCVPAQPSKMTHTDPALAAAELVRGASSAFMQTQCLYTAVKLGVADALAAAGGAAPAADLSEAVGATPDQLERVLRFLVTMGIFDEPSRGVFANNAASELLRGGQPHSMKDMVLHMGFESYGGWGKLADSVKASSAEDSFAFKDWTGGLDYWAWLNKHPAEATHFNRFMESNSAAMSPVVLQGYDWSQHAGATVADVGGSAGGILGALLGKYPGMRGILFDRPPVIKEAHQVWAAAHPDLPIGDRIQLVGGDFFDSVPAADVYFLKHILHDWNDEDSIKILKTVRQAAAPDSRILLCEVVLPEEPLDNLAPLVVDLQMLVMCGSKERSAREWGALFQASGWELEEVVPLGLPTKHGIVVGRPV